jgi:hypothetical protein
MEGHTDLLAEHYFQERKILEEMWIFKQEAKLRLARLKNEILTKIQENIGVDQLEGRADIDQEIKEDLFGDRAKRDKFEQHLAALLDREFDASKDEIKNEISQSKYSPSEYAEYLFRLAKVNFLESELENNRQFPDAIYEEKIRISEEKKQQKEER